MLSLLTVNSSLESLLNSALLGLMVRAMLLLSILFISCHIGSKKDVRDEDDRMMDATEDAAPTLVPPTPRPVTLKLRVALPPPPLALPPTPALEAENAPEGLSNISREPEEFPFMMRSITESWQSLWLNFF
jgi:hypothetical protein